jgi:3-hydroxy-9,10-secoandrosta-1,3,5(10)-triene-9,17-dione monooxygenase
VRIQAIDRSAAPVIAEALVERAAALRPLLFEQQEASDRRGYISDEVQAAFLDAGFYRILTPKMFGGLELEPTAFLKVIMEVARGHPAAAWCYTLAGSHAYFLASHWPEAVQRELFGPDGDFRAAHVIGPAGTMTPVEGGYMVEGVWPFASGIPVSTHFIGGSLAPGADGGPPRLVFFILPRDKVTILPDWGEDRFMGMQASGSNSVKVEKTFVPARHVIDVDMMAAQASPEGTFGTRLHGNPMYLCVAIGWFHCEFGAILTGTARAALDEFARLAKERSVLGNPQLKRFQDPFTQHLYGVALGMADSARALTLAGGELYMEQCRRFARDGTMIRQEDSFQVWGLAREACRLAYEAVEQLFHASGASAGRRDQRLQRYFRDVEMYRLHIQAQPNLPTARGQQAFGLAPQMIGG